MASLVGYDDSDDDDEPAAALLPAALLPKIGGGAASGDDDSDGDDEEPAAAPPPTALPPKATGGAAADAASDDDEPRRKKAALAEPPPPPSAEPAASSVLPSFEDAVESSTVFKGAARRGEDAPFDASQHFRPPPVTHGSFMPVSADSHEGKARARATKLDEEAPEQRYHASEHFGRRDGAVRLRGSMCFETDEQRGRRVVYGAHNMMKADPWSDCNPNMPFRGSKRKH